MAKTRRMIHAACVLVLGMLTYMACLVTGTVLAAPLSLVLGLAIGVAGSAFLTWTVYLFDELMEHESDTEGG